MTLSVAPDLDREAGPQARDARRVELADFLRKRRADLSPERAGLPKRARRRTLGLRREEVAERAGISLALYTWLEQARDVPVSEHTVSAVAQALDLEEHERLHMLSLARPAPEAFLDETVSSAMRRLVFSLRAHPAFVLDHGWNIVLRNEDARFVFGGESDLAWPTNLLEEVVLSPASRTLFSDWPETARALTEAFRSDFFLYAVDDRALRVVERLRERSVEFAGWWSEHRVRARPAQSVVVIDHATAGRLTFEPRTYASLDSPGLRLLAFAPYDDDTERRLKTHAVAHPSAAR